MLLLTERTEMNIKGLDLRKVREQAIDMASTYGGATLKDDILYSFTNSISDELEILSMVSQGIDSKIRLFVPSNIQGVVDKEKQLSMHNRIEAAYLLSGFSEDAVGYWFDSNDIVVMEDILIVNFRKDGFGLACAIEAAKKIKEEMKQEAVSIQIGKEMLLLV